MKSLLIGLLFAVPAMAKETTQFEERIIYIRNGQPFTMWVKKTPLTESNKPAPCLKDIIVRIEHGQQLTTRNPYYEECVQEQMAQEQKANAQERGGDDDLRQ